MSSDKKQYWLISAPNEGELQSNKAFETLSFKVMREHSLGTVSKFEIPGLRCGTLNDCLSLSDDLPKMDQFIEQATKKIGQQLVALDDSMSVPTIGDVDLDTIVTRFQWDEAKYPVKSSTRDIAETIYSQVQKLDEEFRTKVTDLQQLSHQLNANARSEAGNLMVKDLLDIVTPDQLTRSETLTSLLVVVPKYQKQKFLDSYERLTSFVLPRSAKLITEENNFSLYSVTMFKKVADDFKNVAREHRYTVREYNYTEETFAEAKESRTQIATDRDQFKKKFLRWCHANFGEAFMGWMHIKAVRVFVESILRYGVTSNFQPMFVLPKKSSEKKLRDLLQKLYSHLGSVHLEGEDDDETPIAGLSEKIYPYVYFPLNMTI